jgi:hypothetical protein
MSKNVIARATAAYLRSCPFPDVHQQPTAACSGMYECKGRWYAVLRSNKGVLGVYLVIKGEKPERVQTWPEELVFW